MKLVEICAVRAPCVISAEIPVAPHPSDPTVHVCVHAYTVNTSVMQLLI